MALLTPPGQPLFTNFPPTYITIHSPTTLSMSIDSNALSQPPPPHPAKSNPKLNTTQQDTVILVSPDDKVIGSSSKVTSHTFSKSTPRGQLHRAFSVFLFDSSGRLLLQKRASSKITFPDVWTNTCCSHPLHGLTPSEVDGPSDLPSVPGVKNAAVRKLSQELGVPIGQISKSRLKFLTRLHY